VPPPCALRTPEERLPSGGPKEEFGRMIFQKKSSLGDRTKVPWQLLVEVRLKCKETITADENVKKPSPQLSLTLACVIALSKTLPNLHGASRVPAPPRAPADVVY